EIDAASMAFDHVAAPKALLPIEQSARREMLRRDVGDLERLANANLIPPIELVQRSKSKLRHERCVASSRKNFRCEALSDAFQGRDVQVVIMIVAKEDDVDLREVLEGHAGLAHAPRTEQPKRAGAL